LAALFRAAVEAVEPARLVAAHLPRLLAAAEPPTPVLVVGAGKAAERMAAGCEQVLGAQRVHGVVVAPTATGALRSITVAQAGDPLPADNRRRVT